MAHIIIDPESVSLQERFAVIKTPRQGRKRFPEACVEIMDSAESAQAAANSAANLYAAVVYGPSVSSESQRIYYLIRWL